MNPYTGEIKEFPFEKFTDGTADAEGFTVPVNRALTPKEIADQRIRLYSPCACGSGQKFKFCCWKKGGVANR